MFVFDSYDEVEESLYKEPATYVDTFYEGGEYRFNKSCFCSAEIDMSPSFSTLEDLAASISRLESPVVFTVKKWLTEEEMQRVKSCCKERNLEANKESIRGLNNLEISLLTRYFEGYPSRPQSN